MKRCKGALCIGSCVCACKGLIVPLAGSETRAVFVVVAVAIAVVNGNSIVHCNFCNCVTVTSHFTCHLT